MEAHKCGHDGCTAAFRYPLDLQRHARVHEGPIEHEFVCNEPGCTRKFTRKDNLIRHNRNRHSKPITNASASLMLDNSWTTASPIDAPLHGFGILDPRHPEATESEPLPDLVPIDAIDELEQGHDDSRPYFRDILLREAAAHRSSDNASPQSFQDLTWLRESASELEGNTMESSHISQPLPVRDASALSAEHYHSSKSGASPFEHSKIMEDTVFVDTAFSPENLPGHVVALAAASDSSFDIFGEQYQQISRRSPGTALPRDIDDDGSSCAESIFSQESTASTATSLGGSLGTTGFLDMVNRTASALFAGDVASSINSAALDDPGIGRERYRRNIRRMIKTFGKALRAEADTITERRIAAAMQTRRISTHVAQEIMTRADAPRPSSCRPAEDSEWLNEEQHSDTSTESADEDEVVLTQEPEDEVKIRNFVFGSDACMQFKRTLLDFVHKPYEKRIMAALDSSLDRMACYDRDYLARVAREISWVPRDLLCFSQDQSLTMADHFKGYVEDFMGESWNWSPFAARRYPLQADCCRLSWKSVSL